MKRASKCVSFADEFSETKGLIPNLLTFSRKGFFVPLARLRERVG
jgi:hypothetical protein